MIWSRTAGFCWFHTSSKYRRATALFSADILRPPSSVPRLYVRELYRASVSPPLRFCIRGQQHPERIDAKHGAQNRIQKSDDRNNNGERPRPGSALKKSPARHETKSGQNKRNQTCEREKRRHNVTHWPAPGHIVGPAPSHDPDNPSADQAAAAAHQVNR